MNDTMSTPRLMPCPKCNSTGTQFEHVSEGYFRPPTPRFRCHRCAFTAWGQAAIDAASPPIKVTLPEPVILELPAPVVVAEPGAPTVRACRWTGCDRLPRRHGICDRCRNRLRRRMTTEQINQATDADIAAIAARFAGGHGSPRRSTP